jgi:toxin-antitoxin system PIN domain toxin
VTAAAAKRAADKAPACLLDGNVLVALMSADHVHHAAAVRWFTSTTAPFATCPITQGMLLRMLMRLADLNVDAALAVLAQVEAHPRHRFWPDVLSYGDVSWRGVMGHRQVTDAYLAALARRHRGKLATFDRGLAVLHADVALALHAPAD